MDKKTVAEFFDRCAPWWDADMVRNEQIITAILNNAGVRPGCRVLDVACGTGVLFPDYLARGARVTAIDLSPEMAKIAAGKFPQVQVLCGDVETAALEGGFDCVMVYNAFPHFPDPRALVRRLAALTAPGGRLSIAHSMSRAALTDHHKRASQVSIELLHHRELSALMSKWFEVDVIISTDQMYQVCGTRRDPNAPAVQDHPAVPLEETMALMAYMVSHNDAHAQELAALADTLKSAGRQRLGARLMEAVADFDMANASLNAVLQSLFGEMD